MNFKKFSETENLLPSSPEQTIENNGITYRSDGQGRYYISGTATAYSSARFDISDFIIPISIGRGGNGTFSMFNNGTTTTSAVIDFMKNDVVIDEWNFSTNNRTSTSYSAMGGKDINQLYFKVYAGVSIDVTIKPMFTNNGQLPSEFKPHMICRDIFHYIHNTDIDTITTFPAIIYSNDTTATIGLKGNMLQTGTPSPTTPIQPSECGMIVNVMSFASAQTIEDNGVTFVSDGAGRYTVNGTATADASADFNIPEFIIPVSVGAGGQGTFSLFNDNFGGNDGNEIEFYNNTTLIDAWSLHFDNRTNTTYVSMGGKKCNRIRIVVKSGISIDHKSVKPMFTNDSTLPTTYEPYGYKIPISSANTTTPVCLGEVESTRLIRELVLTGSEQFYGVEVPNTNTMIFNFENLLNTAQFIPTVTSLSTHYIYNPIQSGMVAGLPINQYALQYYAAGTKYNLLIHDSIYTSVSAFQTYLQQQYAAGTPVTVWYVLATPTTGMVNEPIRKIGDYADTVSGITIPTITGKDTFDVQTTLKPSEVSLTYHGWHDATVKEWDGSEWQQQIKR